MTTVPSPEHLDDLHKTVSKQRYSYLYCMNCINYGINSAFCGLNNLMDVANEDSICFVGICKLVSPLYIKDISITDKTPGTYIQC